jgi:hypothetical protein
MQEFRTQLFKVTFTDGSKIITDTADIPIQKGGFMLRDCITWDTNGEPAIYYRFGWVRINTNLIQVVEPLKGFYDAGTKESLRQILDKCFYCKNSKEMGTTCAKAYENNGATMDCSNFQKNKLFFFWKKF